MKHETIKLFSIGLIVLIFLGGVYSSFQNNWIYSRTLGRVSTNFERVGPWNNSRVIEVSNPFVSINNENFSRWDASLYNCIKEHLYTSNKGCHDEVRGAFFPLFPLVWRLSSLNAVGISVINYLLFIISGTFLFHYFLKISGIDKVIVYLLLITFPSTVVYLIPYTESLFLFTMVVAAIGIFKKKYWMSFVGIFLMAMVRPATIFMLLAFLAVDFGALLTHKSLRVFLKSTAKKAAPFFAGFLSSIFIQYLYSSSWTTFIDAQKHWDLRKIQWITSFSDWSFIGYGLSVFAMCFVSIPALIFIGWSLHNKKIFFRFYENLEANENNASRYLFVVSMYYLAGIFIFTLLTSGGNVHGFFRYTLASPAFYLASIIGINSLFKSNIKGSVLFLVFPFALLLIFFYTTRFGGNIFEFHYVGMFLSIVSLAFIMLMRRLKSFTKIIATILIVFTNLIWTTYLLNAFMSNGWIFT